MEVRSGYRLDERICLDQTVAYQQLARACLVVVSTAGFSSLDKRPVFRPAHLEARVGFVALSMPLCRRA
jgi:hypothetical protein